MLPLVPPPSKVTQLFKSCGKTPGSCLSFLERTHSRRKNVMMFIFHHSIALKTRLLLIQCGADSVVVSLRQYSFAIAVMSQHHLKHPSDLFFFFFFYNVCVPERQPDLGPRVRRVCLKVSPPPWGHAIQLE